LAISNKPTETITIEKIFMVLICILFLIKIL